MLHWPLVRAYRMWGMEDGPDMLPSPNVENGVGYRGLRRDLRTIVRFLSSHAGLCVPKMRGLGRIPRKRWRKVDRLGNGEA